LFTIKCEQFLLIAYGRDGKWLKAGYGNGRYTLLTTSAFSGILVHCGIGIFLNI